jgi:hypothetical protein
MKKCYLTNNETIETAYFNSHSDALKEAQKRNLKDRNANWKAWDEHGQAIYAVCIIR